MNPIEDKKKDIEEDIKQNPWLLYMKGNKMAPQCGFSGQVIHILNTLNVEYEVRNVLEDDVLREAIKEYSDWPTIPQLYINGEFIGGCDIITEMYQNGDLKKMMAN